MYAQSPGEDAKVKELEDQIKTIRAAKAVAPSSGEQLWRAEQAVVKETRKLAALEQEESEMQKKQLSFSRNVQLLRRSSGRQRTSSRKAEKALVIDGYDCRSSSVN